MNILIRNEQILAMHAKKKLSPNYLYSVYVIINFLRNAVLIKALSCLFFLNATTDPANPSEFPDCPQADIRSFTKFIATVDNWFSTQDPTGNFKHQVFPNGLPKTRDSYNAAHTNPKNVYTTWYASYIAAQEAETAAKKQQEKFSNITGKLSQIASQLGVELTTPEKHKASMHTPKRSGGSKKSSPFKGTPTRDLVDILSNALSIKQQEMQKIKEERDALEEETIKLQKLADRVTTLSPEAKLHRQTSAQLSKELKEAQERLKTTEQRLQELEARLGQEAIGAIHESEPATAMTLGRVIKLNALEHLQQSYMGMIDDIGQASESSVQEDSKTIRENLEAVTKIFPDAEINETELGDIRSQALTLTESAFDVVSRYEDIKIDVFRRKIGEAKNLAILKRTVIDDIFYDVFLSKMSELELRILNLDILQQSLDLTKAYQEHLQRLIELNTYAPAKLSPLRQFLTLSENTFKRKIEERDAAIREAYQPSLVTVQEEINQKYAEYQKGKLAGRIPKEYDFAFIPVPLQLMRSPLAFFSLAKSDFTDKKFNDIQIMDQSLIYLTREQTRAFFVYLYDVSINFSEYKKKYEEMTFTSGPPLQQKDVQELIKVFRNRLKTYFSDNKKRTEVNESEETIDQSTEKTAAEKANFSPAFNDRKAFREFAELIDDLITGTYALKVIKKQLESLRVEFNHKLSGVTVLGIESVIQTETNERVQMVQKILGTIEKFNLHVPQQGGIEAVTSQNIPQLKELISEMKTTQKDIDDKNFPIRKLIEKSTDFIEGSKILESAVVVIAKAPPAVAKISTPIKRPPAPGRPAIALVAPSAESLTTELDSLAQQLEEKRTSSTIAEAKYQELITRIQAARDNVTADALQQAQMKIKSLKRDLK